MTTTDIPPDLKPKRRSRLVNVVIFVMAALLLVLAFRGANWGEMLSTIQQGQPAFLLLVFIVITGSYLLRALRWYTLLSVNRSFSPLTAAWGTAAGYLGNLVLPARAGEVIRSVLIARKTGIPVSYVFATALTERVMDVLALVLFGSLALASAGAVPDWLISAAQAMSIAGLAGIAVFFSLPRLEKWIVAILHRLPVSDGLKTTLTNLLREFLTGLQAIQSVRRGLTFAGLTVIIWSVDILAGLLVMQAFNMTLTPARMMILLAALGLASAAPSTPGYVGIYQFVAVTVLVPFGLTQNQALIFIIAFQGVTYLVVLLWGGLGFWRLNTAAKTPASPVNDTVP